MSRAHQLPAALPNDLPIQELMRRLAEDQRRSDQIAAEALTAWQEGRKVLVLSERTDHVTAIAAALEPDVPELFVLHGRLGQRQRSITLTALQALPAESARIVVATGRLVGLRFDHAGGRRIHDDHAALILRATPRIDGAVEPVDRKSDGL